MRFIRSSSPMSPAGDGCVGRQQQPLIVVVGDAEDRADDAEGERRGERGPTTSTRPAAGKSSSNATVRSTIVDSRLRITDGLKPGCTPARGYECAAVAGRCASSSAGSRRSCRSPARGSRDSSRTSPGRWTWPRRGGRLEAQKPLVAFHAIGAVAGVPRTRCGDAGEERRGRAGRR